MSVCKRTSSKNEVRWIARISLGSGTSGSRVQRRINERTRTECEAEAARLRLHVRSASSSVSLDEWFYDVYLPSSSVREATKYSYERYYRTVISPHLGSTRIDKLTPIAISKWVGVITPKYSLTTIRLQITILSLVLQHAVDMEAISRNPVRLISRPKPQANDPKRWSCEQAKAFIAATKGDKHHLLWRLLLESGCRIGEAVVLKPEDISIANGVGVVHISKSLSSTQPPTIGPTKTNQPRSVEISEDLARQLIERSGPYLFPGSTPGKPTHRSSVQSAFKRACKRTGVSPIHIHGLRHTSASLQLELGIQLPVVQRRLGHSSVQSTAVYARPTDAMTKQAAVSLAGAINEMQGHTS